MGVTQASRKISWIHECNPPTHDVTLHAKSQPKPVTSHYPEICDVTWLMGPNMHAVPACAHTASSYRAVKNGVHDICLLSPPPSRFAGILSSTAAAAATTATAEAEAEAAEARAAAAQSRVGGSSVGGGLVGGSGGLRAAVRRGVAARVPPS